MCMFEWGRREGECVCWGLLGGKADEGCRCSGRRGSESSIETESVVQSSSDEYQGNRTSYTYIILDRHVLHILSDPEAK